MTVSAEGRVENQKLNQAAVLLSFGWVFGFQLDLLEKNLITLTRVTFTENDLMQGVSLNHSNAPIYLKITIFEKFNIPPTVCSLFGPPEALLNPTVLHQGDQFFFFLPCLLIIK